MGPIEILLQELDKLRERLSENIDPRGSIAALVDQIEDLVRQIERGS